MAVTEAASRAQPPLAARIAAPLFALVALAEVGVGLAVLAFPGTVMGLLLAAPLEGVGLVLARMLGIAIAALGLSWWFARKDFDQRLANIAPSFLVYNLGVGVLFLLHALGQSSALPVPWVIAVVHLLTGLAFSALALVQRRK